MLAGLFKAPSKFSPLVNLPAARARANVVLDNLVDAGFMTEGQVYGARRNPATPIDRRAGRRAELLSRLGVRRDAQARRHVPEVGHRKLLSWCVRRSIRTCSAMPIARSKSRCANTVTTMAPANRRWSSPISTAACGRWWAGAIMARASSTARSTRCGSPARRSNPTFTPPPWRTASRRNRSWSIRRSASAIGARITIPAAIPGSITLTQAITNSINVIPVKLSIALGDGNPKLGRAKIIQTARNFGIWTPLPDTPSLPIGADEVNVLEHAVAYATFPNLGKAVTPHAALEVRTGTGELVWRFDRDGKRPQQVISPKVALEMIGMMNSVVENGTGRRAQLDGIKVAGKTGTTNGWRDAWFVGYTGNFCGAVWMGNDDYSPTKRMTGGTIPALIWHNIMAYAHQGVELRPLPGLPPPQHAPTVADAALQGGRRRSRSCSPARAPRRWSTSSICSTTPAARWRRRPLPPRPSARSTARRRRVSPHSHGGERPQPAGTSRRD